MLLDAVHADARPVLVVEDSDDDFDTVVVAAARARVRNRLVRAQDAEVAWHLLSGAPTGWFAFVLLDYNLWGFDGLALLDRIRDGGLLTHLPVVVFTTSVNPRDREALCQAGASAFHLKSVQHTDCLRSLESIFDQWLCCTALPARPARWPSRRRQA
jgi:CheY-like chemotaxis protein